MVIISQLPVMLPRPGVAVIWGPPSFGDPHPNIASDIGTGVTISLSDIRSPHVPITLAVWGSSGDMWIPLILQLLVP